MFFAGVLVWIPFHHRKRQGRERSLSN